MQIRDFQTAADGTTALATVKNATNRNIAVTSSDQRGVVGLATSSRITPYQNSCIGDTSLNDGIFVGTSDI